MGTIQMTESLFQVYETDLSLLERELPSLMGDALVSCNDAMTRKRWEAVKAVLSNVRWNYGPPTQVKTDEGEENQEAWRS